MGTERPAGRLSASAATVAGMDAHNRPQGPPFGFKSQFGPSWWETSPTGSQPSAPAPLPPQLPPPTASQVGRREIAEVEAIVENMDRTWVKWPEDKDKPFYQGIRDTCLWSLGRGSAPFTQVPGPPDLAALRAEDEAAYDEIYHPSRRPLRKDYWVAVQHTTMWLLAETDECSWSMVLNLD